MYGIQKGSHHGETGNSPSLSNVWRVPIGFYWTPSLENEITRSKLKSQDLLLSSLAPARKPIPSSFSRSPCLPTKLASFSTYSVPDLVVLVIIIIIIIIIKIIIQPTTLFNHSSKQQKVRDSNGLRSN